MTKQKSQKKQKQKGKKRIKSIIITALIIHLRSHNHHPNQKHQSDDPESECSIPLRADTVLFQPSQCIDRDATDVVVVDVAVAVGVYIALFFHISVQEIMWKSLKRRRRKRKQRERERTTHIPKQLNSRLNQTRKKQRNQNKTPQKHPRRLQLFLRQQHNHQNHKKQSQRPHGNGIRKQPRCA
jgi:hypothetical protein